MVKNAVQMSPSQRVQRTWLLDAPEATILKVQIARRTVRFSVQVKDSNHQIQVDATNEVLKALNVQELKTLHISRLQAHYAINHDMLLNPNDLMTIHEREVAHMVNVAKPKPVRRVAPRRVDGNKWRACGVRSPSLFRSLTVDQRN